jgi:hypothetical protein
MPLRLARCLVAASLGLALAAAPAPVVLAGPGRAEAPAVKPAHLPTWEEVDALYEGFEDGSRETARSRGTFVLEKNCRTYQAGPKADQGRFADYFGAFQSIPVHAGFEQPAVYTMSFETVRKAKRAFAAQRSWITGCDGETVSAAGETNSYEVVALAGLGDQRIAYRHSMVLEQTGGDPWYLNELVFWIRDGRHLVDVQARQDVEGDTPASAPLLELAEISLDRLP